MEPGKSCQSKGGVSGTEEGFRARFDQCCERDGEFADPEPAGAAVNVGSQGVGRRGLDG